MDATFLINDGQHRKAAIEAALKDDALNGVTAGFPHRPIPQLRSPFFQRFQATAVRSP